MRIACIDFETANRYRSSACELGIVLIEDGAITESSSWRIRPTPFTFEPWNVRIHGITEEDVATSPTFADVWQEAADFIGEAYLAAHNASFDMSVLRHSLKASERDIPPSEYFCTLQLARAMWRDLPSHTLAFLAGTFDIELEHHDALSDANACAQLLIRASTECGASTLNELLNTLHLATGVLETGWGHIPCRGDNRTRPTSIQDYYSGSLTPLNGKAVSLTGKLGVFTRDQGAELIRAAGGEFHPNPKRGTDIVVVGPVDLRSLAKGETKTSKFTKALALQEKGFEVEITTSDDFLQMLFMDENE